MNKPKFSIITVCFNSEKTIEDTMLSVISQTYSNIEFIVIDGKSTDGTLAIINKYKNQITTFISENDNGFYDAINKGIELANGEYIAILNSDDFYVNTTIIEDVVNIFIKNNVDAVYGDLQYVDKLNTNIITRNWVSQNYTDGMFCKGWMPPHPAFFVKKCCYDRFGKFNLQLKSAADYELMLRFIHVNKIEVAYLPKVLVKMRVGGMSNSSIWNRIKANREDKLAWKINGVKPHFLTFILKPLSKIKQFLK